MNQHTKSEHQRPRKTRRLLVALLAVALLAIGAPMIPILGGAGTAYPSQGSGGGGGP